MIPVLSVDNMRKSDARTIELGTPGRELMLRAGHGIFEKAQWRPPVGILCGSGNNAGDGYVIALLLKKAGIPCKLFLLSDRHSEDGAYYLGKCREAGIPEKSWDSTVDLKAYGTIVDCLFGTGFHGEVQGAAREAIEAVNTSGAYVVSVDINSGLNGDSGMAELCVHSDLTVSVGGFKPGHFLNMAKDVMKEKTNIDIGIEPVDPPYHLIEASDLAPLFKARPNFSHKGSYGYIALIGGSTRYCGAVRLAAMANAAMRSGAGVVKVAVPKSLFPAIAPALQESTFFPLSEGNGEMVFDQKELTDLTGNVRTAAFGMGAGTSPGASAVLVWLLEHFTGRLIIDADGLTLLSRMDRKRIRDFGRFLTLTPHLKEFSRLTGQAIEEIQHNPVAAAEAYAAATETILLLKGPATVITDGKTTCITDTGCAGMATAGSGDVLSGILAAVSAFLPENILLSTAAAAWLNGKAGELAQSRFGSVSMTAGDTAACLPEIVLRLEKMSLSSIPDA